MLKASALLKVLKPTGAKGALKGGKVQAECARREGDGRWVLDGYAMFHTTDPGLLHTLSGPGYYPHGGTKVIENDHSRLGKMLDDIENTEWAIRSPIIHISYYGSFSNTPESDLADTRVRDSVPCRMFVTRDGSPVMVNRAYLDAWDIESIQAIRVKKGIGALPNSPQMVSITDGTSTLATQSIMLYHDWYEDLLTIARRFADRPESKRAFDILGADTGATDEEE